MLTIRAIVSICIISPTLAALSHLKMVTIHRILKLRRLSHRIICSSKMDQTMGKHRVQEMEMYLHSMRSNLHLIWSNLQSMWLQQIRIILWQGMVPIKTTILHRHERWHYCMKAQTLPTKIRIGWASRICRVWTAGSGEAVFNSTWARVTSLRIKSDRAWMAYIANPPRKWWFHKADRPRKVAKPVRNANLSLIVLSLKISTKMISKLCKSQME